MASSKASSKASSNASSFPSRSSNASRRKAKAKTPPKAPVAAKTPPPPTSGALGFLSKKKNTATAAPAPTRDLNWTSSAATAQRSGPQSPGSTCDILNDLLLDLCDILNEVHRR